MKFYTGRLRPKVQPLTLLYRELRETPLQRHLGVNGVYRIYSINRPGRLLNFWTLKVGAYSRWALIRGGR